MYLYLYLVFVFKNTNIPQLWLFHPIDIQLAIFVTHKMQVEFSLDVILLTRMRGRIGWTEKPQLFS